MIDLTLFRNCDKVICTSFDIGSILVGMGFGMIFLYYFIIRKKYKYIEDVNHAKGEER